jgi:hypothetical protein
MLPADVMYPYDLDSNQLGVNGEKLCAIVPSLQRFVL